MTLKNRFVRSATWEDTADKDGIFNSKILELMQNLVRGGVGLIITGHTACSQVNVAEQHSFHVMSASNTK